MSTHRSVYQQYLSSTTWNTRHHLRRHCGGRRKQDFIDNESWAPLARFFKYGTAKPEVQYREYGAKYAYAYEQNSIKKENKVSGHLIEHTIVTGMDSTDYYGFAQLHQGAVKLCNDIGTYSNYQLDYVQRKAFYGNPMLRTVSFTDLYGAGAASATAASTSRCKTPASPIVRT